MSATVKDFIEKHNIRITNKWSARNPSMGDESDSYMNHYKSTLHLKDGTTKRQFTLYYSKGKALEGEPTAEEVLQCLRLDMSSLNESVEDFISGMGYDERKGAKVYQTIERQTEKLYDFLGNARFNQLKAIEEEW